MTAHMLLALSMLEACTGADGPPKDSPIDTGTSVDTGPESGESDSASDSDTGADSDTNVDTWPVLVECDRSIPWTSVAAGEFLSCGVHADGCAECWGRGREADAGPSDTEGYACRGEDAPPDADYRRLALVSWAIYEDHDGQHGCGILDDSSILCWGDGTWGETNAPAGTFVDVAVCEYGSYALSPDGALAAWGGMVAPTDGPFTAMAVGPVHEFFLRPDGTLSGWENGGVVPIDVPPDAFLTIQVGASLACGLRTDGSILCWNPLDPDSAESCEMTIDAPVGDFIDVCANDGVSACALGADGVVQCWGDPTLSDGAPGTDQLFSEIACGYGHACGVQTDGQIYCWGYDRYGETLPPS